MAWIVLSGGNTASREWVFATGCHCRPLSIWRCFRCCERVMEEMEGRFLGVLIHKGNDEAGRPAFTGWDPDRDSKRRGNNLVSTIDSGLENTVGYPVIHNGSGVVV